MDPSRLFRLSRSYVQARCLQLAVSKELFTHIAITSQERDCESLGRYLGFKTEQGFRGTRDFLDLLVSIQVLQREPGLDGTEQYSNSTEAAAYLVRGGEQYIGGYLDLEYNRTFPHLIALEEGLTQGCVSQETRARLGIPDLSEVFGANPHTGAHFARAMSSSMTGNFRALAQGFDFSRFSSLTDVGGSLASLSIEVCRAHPHVTASSCDLPNIRQAAEENVVAQGLSDRVVVVDLDMFSDAPFPPADVVALSQILHDWGIQKKMLLLRKAYAALPPGGACIVVEKLIDDDRRAATMGLAQSLVMLLEFGEENSFDFTFRELEGWAAAAGFARCDKLALLPDCYAAVAYK